MNKYIYVSDIINITYFSDIINITYLRRLTIRQPYIIVEKYSLLSTNIKNLN